MPQGSILGPLFFNILINDLFLFIETTTLCNSADDNTMHSSDKSSNIVISRLRHDFAITSEWFYENYMVLNPGKCHFLTLGFNKPFSDFSFENTIIKNVTEEKIQGIVIDNNLNFKSHMKKICEKANQKLSALARISKLTTPTQRKKLINSFINSQFTYCPLIWMFSSKGCYKRINKIHERSLRLILNDYESSFDSLLSTLNEKTIHQRCINVLLTEVYKYLNGYSPDLMNEVFYLRQNHYNLRNFNVFATDNPRNKYLLNSSVYRANQLWQTLPSEIKGCASLQLSKDKIKTWRCERYQCQIYLRYIAPMLVIFYFVFL